jgi:dTDP-glucose 4,6-dehydratase
VPHLKKHPAVKTVKGDVLDPKLPDHEFDYMIHAATDTIVRSNEDSQMKVFDTIVWGTRNILDYAVRCKCKKFLFTSSGAVYGQQPPSMMNVSEDYSGGPDPLSPISAYGEGKRAAEQLCALYSNQYDLDCKIARCWAFVGPYLPLDAHFAVGNFIRDAVHGGPIVINSDGTSRRSYLYAADLVIALLKVLIEGVTCRPYNVGSSDALSIFEIAQIVAVNFNPKPDIIVAKQPIAGIPPAYYVPSTQRIESELGFSTEINTQQAICKTIGWVKKMS